MNLPETLIEARAAAAKLEGALAVARRRASETEALRTELERRHAETVADSLIDGGERIPSKPAALSAAQSADDAADSALVLIEGRLREARARVITATHNLIDSEVIALVERRKVASLTAIGRLTVAAVELVRSVGPARASWVLGRIVPAVESLRDLDAKRNAEHDGLHALASDAGLGINPMELVRDAEIGAGVVPPESAIHAAIAQEAMK